MSARRLPLFAAVVAACSVTAASAYLLEYRSGIAWPKPPVVDPGEPTAPPSDAVVLFDGKDMAAFRGGEQWIVKDGYVVTDKADVTSKQAFGDCQVHLEYRIPEGTTGESQGRCNSGLFLMRRYEVQILDNFGNDTYHDGYVGSLYKQKPPMVNASRPQGVWQTMDVVWTAPRFGEGGEVLSPAYATVLHNGVCVQNHTRLRGETAYLVPPSYPAKGHPAEEPIRLQYHGNDLQYRNIWVRPLVDLVGVRPDGSLTTDEPGVDAEVEQAKIALRVHSTASPSGQGLALVTVRNSGRTTAEGVEVQVQLPESVRGHEAVGGGYRINPEGTRFDFDAIDVPAGGTHAWNVRYEPADSEGKSAKVVATFAGKTAEAEFAVFGAAETGGN